MPKTDHWRTAYKGQPEGPLPYVETEEAFDRVQAGQKMTRAEVQAIVAEEIKKVPPGAPIDLKPLTTRVDDLSQKAEGAASAAKTNATAITKLQQDKANLDQALSELKGALAKADVELTKMDETDQAVGRVMKTFALYMNVDTDLNALREELLKKKVATEKDLDLFGIKK